MRRRATSSARSDALNRELDFEALRDIVDAEDVSQLSVKDLMALTRSEIDAFLPDGLLRVDPRSGDRILYHSSRARRPHDNRPDFNTRVPERACAICQGRTTGIIDVAELSQGFTFINKNLYPIFYPFDDDRVSGLHLLQWTSSQHSKDWHNMTRDDRAVVMGRLAVLEQALLDGKAELAPLSQSAGPMGAGGYVIIIKNYGHLVGGSLTHGHQQIAFTNVMPSHFLDNARYERKHGETFCGTMVRQTTDELIVKDYGTAFLIVPPFMRRPYDMLLLMKDSNKAYLHELSSAELEAIAEGWHDAIRAIRTIMPRIGREIAYNVVTNNGPGAGLYFDFLPYTQEIGGVEHLGLFVCQELPERAADRLREILG